MPEGHDTIIEVSNIMSFVLYTQILKQSVLKPASPGITLMYLLYREFLLCAYWFNILVSHVEICVTGELRFVISLMVISHTKKVNVSYKMFLNLRKGLEKYFVMYIGATPAMYFKRLSLGMTLVFFFVF